MTVQGTSAKPKTRRASNVAKGRRIVGIARDILVGMGMRVEVAPLVAQRVRDRFKENGIRIITVKHDFFQVWDLLCVSRDGDRFFVQVTVQEEVPHRRSKILASGFPCRPMDLLLGWKGGRDRHFRVFRGPGFERWDGECWRPKPTRGKVGED